MSLYGALFSAVSGLSAESSAMSALSDNISNLNTVGYKETDVNFSTLVTSQTSSTQYAPGGVQAAPRQQVDLQGLLQATNSSTDMALSGNGFFVVNTSADPAVDGGQFLYTRAGSFVPNQQGILQNSAGYYLQGWPLVPTDNSVAAVPTEETIDGTTYMKAYKNPDGTTHYINQNVIDPSELQPLNVNDIGGTATATSNVSLGLNLPSSDPVFDPNNPSAGGAHDASVLLFDTLGDTENAQFNWTKIADNSWGLSVTPPTGAATATVLNQVPNGAASVYAAQGQLEFNSIPPAGAYFTLTDVNGTGARTPVRIQFYNSSLGGANGTDPTTDETSGTDSHLTLGVNLNGISNTDDLVSAISTAITQAANSPSANPVGTFAISTALLGGVADGASRFVADGSVLRIVQEPGADEVDVNVSDTDYNVPVGSTPADTGLGTSIVESQTGAGSGVDPKLVGTFNVPAIANSKIAAYTQMSTAATQNSFTVTSALAGLSANTGDYLQIGTTQVPWKQILAGSVTGYTTAEDAGVAAQPVTLTNAIALTYKKNANNLNTDTIDFSNVNGNDANAANLAATNGSEYLQVNGLQIPWSWLAGGGTQTSLNAVNQLTGTSTTINLQNSITLPAASSYDNTNTGVTGANAGLAANIATVISALASDSNAGGYIGTLTATQSTSGNMAQVTFNSAAQVSNIVWDGGTTTVLATDGASLAAANVAANGNATPENATIGGNTAEAIGTTLSAGNVAQNAADAINGLASPTAPDTTPFPAGFPATPATLNPGSATVELSSSTAPPTAVVPINQLGYATWADGTDGSNGEVMGVTGTYNTQTGAAITFNGDGTPATINPNAMEITWANGSENQIGTSGSATQKPQISLNFGNVNESNGITQLGGDYQANFINQNGAKFGNYSGLSIGTDGVVTALFDNGVRSPVFQIPIATFPNADGLSAQSGNVWQATTSSGSYTLRTPGTAGSGTVNQSSLESSTVDLGTQFTNMIIVQRAYSAATKVITTADSMLSDLLNVIQG